MDGERFRFSGGEEKLFSIREAARICGISRTTLLRLEEAGFYAPRKVDPKNGYRWYDAINILRIQQYQALRKLGLAHGEIMTYFKGEMNRSDFLAKLRERLFAAQRCYDEFSARFTERESLTFSFFDLPDATCYTFPCPIREITAQCDHNYREIEKMYAMGFKPYPATPMFSLVPGPERIYEGKEPEPYASTICVLVQPDAIPDPSKVIYFRRRRAYSMLYHGNKSEIMQNGGQLLFEEMRRIGLKPKGPLYGICVVGPFFGDEIDPNDYAFRFAIPIEEDVSPAKVGSRRFVFHENLSFACHKVV